MSETSPQQQPAWLAIPTQREIERDREPAHTHEGPCGCDGYVYLLHFDRPIGPAEGPGYKQARHYTGHAGRKPTPGYTPRNPDLPPSVDQRLAVHEAGRGARLTQVAVELGIGWTVADVQPGDYARERQLKSHAARRCGICKEAQEERRGPGGRAYFADPRLGDFPGRNAETELEAGT
jgi:hypothetical protein